MTLSLAPFGTRTVGASAGFLEYTGQGLKTFERALDRDERLMAVLGARLLEGQKRMAETAEAIELRQSGEKSILGNLALSVSASLTQVLATKLIDQDEVKRIRTAATSPEAGSQT